MSVESLTDVTSLAFEYVGDALTVTREPCKSRGEHGKLIPHRIWNGDSEVTFGEPVYMCNDCYVWLYPGPTKEDSSVVS